MENQRSEAQRTCLVTGAAGFIGFHTSKRLLEQGFRVIGLDNVNEYYDTQLKTDRLALLEPFEGFQFLREDLIHQDALLKVFADYRPELVIHLAAQAGVRYSVEHPEAYIQSNILGFFHVLEACRAYPVRHLIYASSSSVYGNNRKVPFCETDSVDHPVSLYAATKKADELMAYTYSHLYGIPATGLRFFTVYGPLGRPDMAYFKFTDQYFAGEPIVVYKNEEEEQELCRDFTYIDDVTEGILRLLEKPSEKVPPHQIFNIGNNHPEKLTTFIQILEDCLSRSLGERVAFRQELQPLRPEDVTVTYASTDRIREAVGFHPETPISEGLQHFTDWYVERYIVCI